jgi:hypothetical protein
MMNGAHTHTGSGMAYISRNMKKTLTTLTCFSLYNALRERESAYSLFSDLTPVIFFNSPTRWSVVAPPRRSPQAAQIHDLITYF